MNMFGDQDGIDLWKEMSLTSDLVEKVYVAGINNAAMTFGSAYFTDTLTQYQKPLNNQAVWKMTWQPNKQRWEISLFCVPEGAKKRSPRLNKDELDWIEIDVDDVILE